MNDARKLARQLGVVQADAEGVRPVGPLWAEREPLLLRALEPRILLDAAGGADALDLVSGAVHGELADAFFDPEQAFGAEQTASWTQAVEALETVPPHVSADQPGQQRSGGEIAFIASDVDDVQTLISSLSQDVEIVLLSEDGSGVAQIAEALRHHSDVDAVHIFSHGADGTLSLGGEELTIDTMSSIYAADLASIGSALSDSGDILIYGCDFASGEAGQEAAHTLAQITGADVAASDDLTGHESLDGDWELESRTGTVEARTLTAGTNWIGTLASQVLVSHESDIDDIGEGDRASLLNVALQSFTYDSGAPNYEVDQIDLVLRLTGGSSSADALISIRETLFSAAIASGTIAFDALSNDYEWHSIELDSTAVLESGREYLIMVSSDTAFAELQLAIDDNGTFADGQALSFGGDADALFRVIDNDTNSAPLFTGLPNDAILRLDVDENEPVAIDLDATDADGDALTYSIVTGASQDSFEIDPTTGVLSFVPPPDFENPTDASGQDNTYGVTVGVSDGNGGMDEQRFVFTVQDVNEAPEITSPLVNANGRIDVDENQTAVTTVVADDPEGDTLSYSIIAEETPGTFTIDPNSGVLSFLAPPDFENPTDAVAGDNRYGVTVEVSDGRGGTVTQVYNVQVEDVNEAPQITSPAGGNANTINIDENQTAITTVAAFDPEGDAVTYSIIGGASRDAFEIDAITGGLSFVAPSDFENPTDSGGDNNYGVRVQVADASGETSSRFFVVGVQNVNETPAALDDAFAVLTNGTVAIDVLNNDDDEDGDALTIAQVNGAAITDGGGPVTVGNGTVVLNAGQLVFTPTANYTGPASFSYVISDGNGLTATAFVSGTVTLGATAPNARDDTITVREDGTVTIDVLSNDDDANGDALTVINVDGQAISTTSGAIDVEKGRVRLVGGQLVFEATANENGAASFNYTINDSTGLADTATVNLNILSVNDAPIGPNTILTMPEDAVAVFDPLRFPFFDPDDPDNDLSAIIIDTLPDAGMLEISGIPVIAGQRIEVDDIGTVTFTPDLDTNSTTTPGTDYTSFTMRVVDDGGTTNGGVDTDQTSRTFTVRVTPENDAPLAVSNEYDAIEDAAFVGNAITDVSPLGVDSDIEGDALTLNTTSVGTFATVEGGTITLTADGDFTYLAPADFIGTDSFEYTVTDGVLNDTATLSFDVAAVNDAPIARDNIYSSNEDEAVNGNAVTDDTGLGVDSDVDTEALVLDATSVGTFTTQQGGTITLTVGGDFTYVPPADFAGTDTFIYTVTDGFVTDTAELTFVVGAVNDAPAPLDDVFTVAEDATVSIDVLANDGDAEGSPLIITHVNNQPIFEGGAPVSVANGSVRLSMDRLLFTPNANYYGPAGFTYSVSDVEGGKSTATATGEVTPVNDAPVASDMTISANDTGNEPISGSFLSNPSGAPTAFDPDGDALFLTPDSIGTFATLEGGTIIVAVDGSFTYTPPADFTGSDEFTATVTDGTAAVPSTVSFSDIDTTLAVPEPEVENNVLPDPKEDPEEEPEEEEKPKEDEEEKEPGEELEDVLATTPSAPFLNQNDSPSPPPAEAPVVLKPVAPAAAVPAPQPVGPTPDLIRLLDPILKADRETSVAPQLPTIAPRSNYDFKPIDRESFTNELERTGDEIRQYDKVLGSTAAKVTFGFGAVLGVGSVTWILQSGILAATLLSALPAWKRFDPIGVVSGGSEEEDQDRDEQSDLQVLMQNIRDAGARTRN